jgi:aryl-alcohol dehydrogenase-like predicted oxidoreductase
MLDSRISRLALASSYGAGACEVESAFERGVTFFFWGALRRTSFGSGLRRLASKRRDATAIAVQSYAHEPWMLRPSIEIARARLGVDRIDMLCLAYRNGTLAPRIVSAARALVHRGLVGSIIVSSHDRALLASLTSNDAFTALMVRYNAAHRGAAHAVFPAALAHHRPILAYTATRWGSLLDPASLPPNEPPPRASDCYRFVLSHPAVTSCLFAPANEREMIEALEALERGPMTTDELAWMARIGDAVRSRIRAAPPLGPRDYIRHAIGMARSIHTHGVTEDLLSRFNREPPS